MAQRRFRKQRLDEPLALYSAFFGTFEPIFSEIVDRLPAMAEGRIDADVMAELVRDDDVRTALRYLTAPPVSEDDLKTLAETQRKCGRMIRSMNSSTCSMSGAAGWMVTCSIPASSSALSLATMSPTLPSR